MADPLMSCQPRAGDNDGRRFNFSRCRPREGGDPYAAASQLSAVGRRLYNDKRRWLWVPAFAGTTSGVPPSRFKQPKFVIAGLDPAIHPLRRALFSKTDGCPDSSPGMTPFLSTQLRDLAACSARVLLANSCPLK